MFYLMKARSKALDCLPESSETVMVFPGISTSGSWEHLLDRVIRDNDPCAFESLFNMMYRPLCRFCLRIVRVREVAEEVVSDVFHTIWQNRDRIEVTSHRSYLYTAVRNRGLDYLRSLSRMTPFCDLQMASHVAVDLPDSHELITREELDALIRKSIAALPDQRQLIFRMSREDGLKYREIAQRLNISVKTVETQMGRALRHLNQSVRRCSNDMSNQKYYG